MRLHVAVHDAFAVAKVQRFEEFMDIVSHIQIIELGVQASEIGVVYVFEDQ